MRYAPIAAVALMAVLTLAGCKHDKKQYEVNDKNCTPEHLQSLPDGKQRQKLTDECAARPAVAPAKAA